MYYLSSPVRKVLVPMFGTFSKASSDVTNNVFVSNHDNWINILNSITQGFRIISQFHFHKKFTFTESSSEHLPISKIEAVAIKNRGSWKSYTEYLINQAVQTHVFSASFSSFPKRNSCEKNVESLHIHSLLHYVCNTFILDGLDFNRI